MTIVPIVALARPSDAFPIADMSRAYIEYGLGWSWTQARVLKAIQDPSTNVAVVREADAILAFGIMRYGEQRAHLVLLAVRPDHRKRGLGALLMSWLEKCAATAGLEKILLEARADNAGALAFYLEQGYRQNGIAPGYYRGTVDAMRLEKALRS